MKNIKFLIIFVAIAMINCERDDICAETTQTTPRLIIEFYDASSTDELKNVPRLTVYGEGLIRDENDIEIEPEVASDETIIFNDNVNLVELPLRIGTEGETITTRFVLEKDTNSRLDTDTATESNIDIIEITYNSEFVFVSRACGYKSIFKDLIIEEDSNDLNPWISNIQIEETIAFTIENENTTHVRIFH